MIIDFFLMSHYMRTSLAFQLVTIESDELEFAPKLDCFTLIYSRLTIARRSRFLISAEFSQLHLRCLSSVFDVLLIRPAIHAPAPRNIPTYTGSEHPHPSQLHGCFRSGFTTIGLRKIFATISRSHLLYVSKTLYSQTCTYWCNVSSL